MNTQDAKNALKITGAYSQKDLKKAYRKAASACHPDTHPNDKDATQKFQKIGEAYDLLKNGDSTHRSIKRTFTDAQSHQTSTPKPGNMFSSIFSNIKHDALHGNKEEKIMAWLVILTLTGSIILTALPSLSSNDNEDMPETPTPQKAEGYPQQQPTP